MGLFFILSALFTSIEQEQTGKTSHQNKLDGIDFENFCTDKCGDEKEYADPKLPGILLRCGKVLLGA